MGLGRAGNHDSLVLGQYASSCLTRGKAERLAFVKGFLRCNGPRVRFRRLCVALSCYSHVCSSGQARGKCADLFSCISSLLEGRFISDYGRKRGLMIPKILAGVAVAVVVLLVVLRASLGTMTTKRQRVMALFLMGLLPMLWMCSTMAFAVKSMETVAFCTQCHSMKGVALTLDVEEPEDEQSLVAAHYQNNRVHKATACYDCHVVHTFSGIVKAKINGLKEAYIEYLGTPRAIPGELTHPYDTGICLHCHHEGRDWRTAHEDDLKEIESGELSCLECHDVAHNFGGDKDE